MRDHPSQRLMIKCLTIIQIEMEFGIDCGRFLFSPAPSLLTHPSPLLCQISDVTFQLTGYRGQTELGKMFRIDYRRFLFSPSPSPNRSLLPTSPRCFVQPWCSLACSISLPRKRKGNGCYIGYCLARSAFVLRTQKTKKQIVVC